MPDIVLSVADLRKHAPQSSVGPYLSTKARVMCRRLATTFPGRGFQGVPVTNFSAFSFQRLPSTFRRTGRAKIAPFSNPMTCSSLPSDFPSQIAVPAIVEFREISSLGKLVPNRLSDFRNARCVFTLSES